MTRSLLFLFALALWPLWPVTAFAQTAAPAATTDIHTPTGAWIATASFSQASDQVQISINFRDRMALVGTHGIHIHSVAQCYPPGYESAGPIFNPFGKQHGLLNPDGPMAGDLPNLVIGPAGVAVYNLAAPLVTLNPGPNSLLGGMGTSLVIYAQPDDDKTPPEGNAGQRIACGAIVAGTGSGATSGAASALSTGASASTGAPDWLGVTMIVVLGALLVIGGLMLRSRPHA